MYAIIENSGKQYKVEEGVVVYTEKQLLEAGAQIVFDRVILVRSDSGLELGKPYIEGAKVTATITEHVRDDKVFIVKFKGRKMYRRKKGHRQWKTAVRIDKIEI